MSGGDRIYSLAVQLNLSQGFWSEFQFERKIRRTRFTALLAAGGVVYPEQNEVSYWYFFPALRVGVNREIFGL